MRQRCLCLCFQSQASLASINLQHTEMHESTAGTAHKESGMTVDLLLSHYHESDRLKAG